MANVSGGVQIETKRKHELSIPFQSVTGDQSLNVGTLLMQFIGFIVYDTQFWLNILFGLLVAAPFAFTLHKTTKDRLVRFAMFVYIAVYIFPYFVVQSWADHDVNWKILAIHSLFFVIVLTFSNFAIRLFRPNINSLPNAGEQEIAEKSVSLNILFDVLFWLLACFWFIYFLLYPEHSGFFTYFGLNNTPSHPRFSFYDANDAVKGAYVLFLRIVALLAILSASSRSRHQLFIVVIVSALIALQSVERQNLVVLVFVLFVISIARRKPFEYKESYFVLLLSLILAIVMQGNVEIESDDNLLSASMGILFVRIIADLFYMSSFLFETYDGNLLFGSTSRIFDYVDLGLDYAVGWSAIGLMPDLYLNFGYFGYIFGAVYYSILLTIAASLLAKAQGFFIQIISFVLYLIALIGLFYSNTFSLVPAFIFMLATSMLVIQRGGRFAK